MARVAKRIAIPKAIANADADANATFDEKPQARQAEAYPLIAAGVMFSGASFFVRSYPLTFATDSDILPRADEKTLCLQGETAMMALMLSARAARMIRSAIFTTPNSH